MLPATYAPLQLSKLPSYPQTLKLINNLSTVACCLPTTHENQEFDVLRSGIARGFWWTESFFCWPIQHRIQLTFNCTSRGNTAILLREYESIKLKPTRSVANISKSQFRAPVSHATSYCFTLSLDHIISNSASFAASGSPVSGNEAPYGSEKQRLTEEQKKENHIRSEKKRRFNVRTGLMELARIMPGSEKDFKSEIKMLNAYDSYVKKLVKEREMLVQELEAKGVAVEDSLKKT